MTPRRSVIPLFLCAWCALMLGEAPDAFAKLEIRVHLDTETEITREVDTFEVEKVGEGYAVMKLVPHQADLERTLLQLGKKQKLGEVPIPGEATWLVYVPATNRVVVRFASALKPEQVPAGTVVLSVRPDPKPVAPMDGAVEGAQALAALGFEDDAQSLLSGLADDPGNASSRCRLLKALLDLLAPTPAAPGDVLSPNAQKTIRSILAECNGVEVEAATRILVRSTLERLRFLQESGKDLADQKMVLQDALGVLNSRPGGDQLVLALAKLHEREGDAEEGSRVLEQFFKTYPASSLKDQARIVQEALARRAPARGYKALGALGSGSVLKALEIREVTDLAFDSQGRLLILDGGSKPRKLVVAEIDPDRRTLTVKETASFPKAWDPIAVARALSGTFYLIDSGEDQLVGLIPQGEASSQELFPTRGEGWKLRSPRRVACLGDKEVLVFDSSREALLRFNMRNREYAGSIDLAAAGLPDPIDLVAAPDGKVLAATRREFSVFSPDDGIKRTFRALRGGTHQLDVARAGMCRWRYVYLFDQSSNRLEKFRRNGDWLTTALDCRKEGIGDPGPWAVSGEGDIVLYDDDTEQFYYFTQ